VVTLENCIFDSCDAATSGHFKGGAVFVGQRLSYQGPQARATVTSCLFRGNRGDTGGAVAAQEYGEVTLDQCSFVGNVSDLGGGVALGFAARAAIINCTFFGNAGLYIGGGLYYAAGTEPLYVTLENTIVAYSVAGEGIYCYDGGGLRLAMSCCDIYGNEGGDWVGYVADLQGINGNFWGNPGFCDTLNADFTLRASSPCMPDDILGCGLIGAHGQGCSGDTLVVADDGDGDYTTIQAALDSCEAWDVIELLDGTFTGEGNRDISIPQKPVTIRSRSGDPSACLIAGQEMPPSYHFGLRFEEGNGQEAMVRDVGMAGFHSLSLGGALQCPDGSPRIAGCLLTGNSANDGGGAVHCDGVSAPLLVGCTLSGNQAPLGGGVYCEGTARPALQNSIVAFSPSGCAVYCDGSAEAALSCCCVYGNAGGDWVGCIEDQGNLRCNFEVDPCFCAEGGGDYFLHSDSPCAGGWPGCGLIGCMPNGCGTGMCEWPTSTVVDSDAFDSGTVGVSLALVPNPCLKGSRLSFTVPGLTGTAGVELAIHDASGRFVRLLDDEELTAGDHTVLWDGKDQAGRPVPAGVYFCRLRVGAQTAVRPVLLIRWGCASDQRAAERWMKERHWKRTRTRPRAIGVCWLSPSQWRVEVNMRFLMVVAVLWTLLACPARGETYVVRPDGTGDFPTIQDAIDAVVDGDVIELADGIFQGDGNRDIRWEDKEITLRSQGGDPYSCILNCEGARTRYHRGIYIHGVGSGARIEGITIRNGVSSGGGGVAVENSSLTIERCVFLDNEAPEGGGLMITGNGSPVMVLRCTFSGNWALEGGGLCI
jgi:hypothetical protein